jgi:hypothetical protein
MIKKALGKACHLEKAIMERVKVLQANPGTGTTLLLADALMCASKSKAYDESSPTIDIFRCYSDSFQSGIRIYYKYIALESDPSIKFDTCCFETIPHCVQLAVGKSAAERMRGGEDGVCLPKDYDGECHSDQSLRCLLIAYLYLFRWVKWDPYFTSHGSLVARVICSEARTCDDFSRMMELGELESSILEYHPGLVGRRVLVLVHESLVDRGLGVVSRLVLLSVDHGACKTR